MRRVVLAILLPALAIFLVTAYSPAERFVFHGPVTVASL
jgi:hypothetical protein